MKNSTQHKFDIPLMRPHFGESAYHDVRKVIDSGFLTEGQVADALETELERYLGCAHALVVCNATVGLDLAMRAIGAGPGDEFIVPDYTHPATAAAVRIVGADLVLVDADPVTLNIDYDALEMAITSKTKGVVPVSLFGNPLDYQRLDNIKEKHGVVVIEDAACSLGSELNGRKVGSFSDVSVFSFHPRKVITSGEGGVVTTNDADRAKWMSSYKRFGAAVDGDRKGGEFIRVGTNYKLSDVQAALALAQLRDVDETLTRRRALAERYQSMLEPQEGIALPKTTTGGRHTFQTFCVLIENRDHIMRTMRDEGIEVQIGSYALHTHAAFADGPHCRWQGRLLASRRAADSALALPLYDGMKEADHDRVVETLIRLLGSEPRQA